MGSGEWHSKNVLTEMYLIVVMDRLWKYQGKSHPLKWGAISKPAATAYADPGLYDKREFMITLLKLASIETNTMRYHGRLGVIYPEMLFSRLFCSLIVSDSKSIILL